MKIKPELSPSKSFSKMQEYFAEQEKWSSLDVSVDDISKEIKALVQDLSNYDPCIAVPLIASLMTVPKYQSNCLRLELLAVLAWRYCKGRKKANIGQAVRWFRAIGKSRCALGEDPAEDVFASLVIGIDADFRILEGLWESAGFYTQIIYDIVQTMPNEGYWATIKKRVDAILNLSEIMCQNASIFRYQKGDDEPQKTLSSRHLPGRNALVKRVRIPFTILETRGILPDDLDPFIIDSKWKDEIGNQRASQTALHFRPLAILDSEAVTVVLPTCLSLAMREYIIGEIVSHGLEDAFDKMLANKFSALLYDTPLLGGPRRAPVHWRKAGQHQISSFGFQFDEGHFISLHFFVPSIRTHAEGGFADIFVDDGSLTAALQKDIIASMNRFEKEDGFQAGMTLVIGGGWGKGYATRHFDIGRARWHFESISIADLVRVSWMPDMKPEYFWRIQDGLSAVESKGVEIVNPNGVLNLIGWVRKNDGHFVPHAQLLTDPITPDHPLMLNPPLNMLREVRAEADVGFDKHGAYDEAGKRHIVQRPSSNPFFESDGSKKLYASMTDIRNGTLTSCYEGKFEFWMSIDTPNISDKDIEYRLWEMANEWLHRIGTVLDEKLANKINSMPLRTNLVFLDSFVPDGAKAKPDRAELENLFSVRVSCEQRCATVMFEAGFFEGFRVAENLAERMVVRGLLSGILEMILGDLPFGIVAKYENAIVPNEDARSFHFFQSQSFLDYVRQLLPNKLVTVDEIDDGIAKLGLAWRARNPADGTTIEGRSKCSLFLNKVVDCLLGDIESELKMLPRREFLNLLVQNIEKSNAEEDHWQKTSAAILGLHGNTEYTRHKYVEQSSQFAGAGIASRVLVEMAICTCPIEGTVQPTKLSMTRLISKVLLVARLGGLSDAIRFSALQPKLTLSALGDILFKNDFGELVVEPMLARVMGERFVQTAPKQKKNYGDYEVIPEAKNAIDQRFWEIWIEEMGFDIDQARSIIDDLEDLAITKQAPVLELTRSEFMRAVIGGKVNRPAARAFLDRLTLTPRPRWDRVPDGFNKKDIYPWRYGRRLSFVTRPIVQVNQSDDPLLVVAPYSLRKGFAYVLNGVYTGSLDQSFFESTAMRDEWWGSANEGHKFEISVEDAFLKKGWKVSRGIQLTEILNKKLDKDYGDVDVFVWREDKPTVLIIECKNLQSARNYSEIAAMLSEYQGKTENGKRDKLKRHLDRVDLLAKNTAEICKFVDKDHIELISCLCCSDTVPMQYSKIEALEMTWVGPVDELIARYEDC